MKRNDKILIGALAFLIILGFGLAIWVQTSLIGEGDLAIVTYRGQDVLEIDLSNGEARVLDPLHIFEPTSDETHPYYSRCFNEENIYCVMGDLGPVVIQFNQGMVRIIYETSPQNICQLQGQTNSPAKDLICLPNSVIIKVISTDDDIDIYT